MKDLTIKVCSLCYGFVYQKVQGKPWGTTGIVLNVDLDTGNFV